MGSFHFIITVSYLMSVVTVCIASSQHKVNHYPQKNDIRPQLTSDNLSILQTL